MNKSAATPLIILVMIQIIDILVHMLASGVEPVRAVSNAVIVLAAVAAVPSVIRPTVALVAGGLFYFGLNAVFVLQHGLINPATEAPRLPLVAFFIGSLICLVWLWRRSVRA